MRAADLSPVRPADRTQSAFDLFLIFAGANIVATTLQVGATLSPMGAGDAMWLVLAGSLFGSALVAALAPVGSRLGVPSIVATRAVLGWRGAQGVAVLLYVTNFAWIAINNVIAASMCAHALGGDPRAWAVALGVLATATVAGGPRAVGLADRVAVPALLVAAAAMTVVLVRIGVPAIASVSLGTAGRLQGFDVVVGYQVSWLLMFADYPRYTASSRRSTAAVFAGLALTSLWFMPLGWMAARVAGSSEPGAMVMATGLGGWGALLITLATLTTNFVNIYMSALAWKSLAPRAGDQAAVWSIGLIGAGLSLFSTAWLDRFGDFMVALGAVLLPVGGVLVAHFALRRAMPPVDELYDPHGPCGRTGGIAIPGVVSCAAGAAAYWLCRSWGGTLPALTVSIAAYLLLARPRTDQSSTSPESTARPG